MIFVKNIKRRLVFIKPVKQKYSLSQDEETVGEIRGLAAGYEVLPTRRGCWTAAAGFGRPGLDKAAA